MSDLESLEGALDEQIDYAGEGLSLPDETDLAQDFADRQAAESQKDTVEAKEEGGEEDLTGERFAYTFEDGTEIEGTITEIAAAIAEKQVAEEVAKLQEAKPAAPEKPAEAKQPEQETTFPFEIRPLNLDKTGDVFQTMLAGGDPEAGIGGPEQIGHQLNEFVFQVFAQENRFRQLMDMFVDAKLNAREQGVQKEAAFKEFLGDEPNAADIDAFMKANPWCETRKEASLSIQLNNVKKSGTEKAKEITEVEAKAKKAGATETVKNLKAKGQLRRVGTPAGSGQRASTNVADNVRKELGITKQASENQRIKGMTEHVMSLRERRQ